ncbi:MAG: glycosyltransferase [Victivallaceae bacterium]|nr:glycosyltransferase [Victivallaceae bacterium]
MKKILIYCNPGIYGGHEIMTVRGIDALLSAGKCMVKVLLYEDNIRLINELDELDNENLHIRKLSFCSQYFEDITAFFSFKKIRTIRNEILAFNPDIFMISQGSMLQGGLALLAARRTFAEIVSYVPITHRLKRYGGWWRLDLYLRQFLIKWFYAKIPGRYITICDSMRDNILTNYNKNAAVDVVFNPVGNIPDTSVLSRKELMREYGFGENFRLWGIIGRIECCKGQNKLVGYVGKNRDTLKNIKFCIIGDGDRRKLIKKMKKLEVEHFFYIFPWINPVPYRMFDGIVIPSNYEGVPLVMLEAMNENIPVIASNVDGMCELLPEAWLVDSKTLCGLSEKIRAIMQTDNTGLLRDNKDFVLKNCSISMFSNAFAALFQVQKRS